MKEKRHFEFGVVDVNYRLTHGHKPLLSTRAIYSSALQRKAFEQKILESLEKGKDPKKLAEYKKAQAMAASVMDLVGANSLLSSP